MLKNSPLNSVFTLSAITKCLMREASRSTVPGPTRILRRELPNRGVPFARSACNAVVLKQFRLNQSFTDFGPCPLHVRSGLGDPELVLEKSEAEVTVKGYPL